MSEDEQTEKEARRRRKAWLFALLLILLIVLVTDAAFFFDTTKGADIGRGAGSGVPGGRLAAKSYTIRSTTRGELRPAGGSVAIELIFSNPNAGNGGSGADGVRVSDLRVEIVSVTSPDAAGGGRCTADDFVLTQFTGDVPFLLPEGESSLSSLGFPPSSWPRLSFADRSVNQDGCENATVSLAYEGSS